MKTAAALLALVLLTACSAVGVPSTPTPSPTPSPSPPPTPSPSPSVPPGARILAPAGLFLEGEPFRVAAATTPNELTGLWAALGKDGAPPEVDFATEIVIFLGMSGSSSCPERFERIVVDETTAHVYGEWAPIPPGIPCTDDLQAQGVLLAVSKSLLPNDFRLTLREGLVCDDCPEHPDQIVVSLAQDV